MSYVQKRKRFPSESLQYEIDKLDEDTKNKIFLFEISTLKNNEKFNKTLNSLNENKAILLSYSNKIKGFNYWAGLIAFSFTHYIMLLKRKQLLYEIRAPQIYLHLGIAVGAGIIIGLSIGNILSYNFGLYRNYSKSRRNFNKLMDEFTKTYNPQTVMKLAE